MDLAEVTAEPLSADVVHRHAPTSPLDEDGQGDAHVSFAVSAHRAIVDVDPDLGLVRVVELTTLQLSDGLDRVQHPSHVLGCGQLHDPHEAEVRVHVDYGPVG